MGEIADELDVWHEEPPDTVTCNRCGKGGFEWEKTGMGWRLVDSMGALHSCKRRDRNG